MNPTDVNHDNATNHPINENNWESATPKNQTHNELDRILTSANKFHATALPLNRNGQLADEQISRVRSKLFGPTIFIIVSLGVIGYQIYNQLSKYGSIRFTTQFIILIGIMLVIAIYAVISFSRYITDLRNRSVVFVEGRGRKEKHVHTDEDGADSKTYYYVIGEEKFQVSRKAYQVFVDDLLYRAYFTPTGKTLVNIEALESPHHNG